MLAGTVSACEATVGSEGDTGTTGLEGTSTGSPSECMPVADEDPSAGAQTTIRIRNETTEVQYLLPFELPAACGDDLALLSVSSGQIERSPPSPAGASCWDAAQWVAPSQCFDPYEGPACDENFARRFDTYAVAPGGVLEVPWDGRLWRQLGSVSSCRGCDICGGCEILEGERPLFAGCRVADALEPATSFVLEVAVTATCPADDPATCGCMSGVCPISTYATSEDGGKVVQADGVVGEDLEVAITP